MRSILTTNAEQILNFDENCVCSVIVFIDVLIVWLGRGRRRVDKKREREEKDEREANKKHYKKAWLEIKDDNYPTLPSDMEQYFLAQISLAEGYHAKGIFYDIYHKEWLI